MKNLFLFALLLMSIQTFSQKKKEKTLSKEESAKIINTLNDQNFVLKTSADMACKCIDSIELHNKSNSKVAGEIAECIHKEVMMYQIMKSILDTGNTTIVVSEDKNSSQYKKDYYDMERWMRDSCEALKNVVASNNERNKHSVTDDPEALKMYNEGIGKMDEKKYEEAIVYYKKALAIDSKFAFCWDNLGICYRKLEKYNEALDAYNNSLKVDPEGVTPLQNIAIVYEFQKDYKKAIFAYKNFINAYKNDPEGYYGLGRMYFISDDYENALQNICKAYNMYSEMQSPYRTDAESMISVIYQKMKKTGIEKTFDKIMKENNIAVDNK